MKKINSKKVKAKMESVVDGTSITTENQETEPTKVDQDKTELQPTLPLKTENTTEPEAEPTLPELPDPTGSGATDLAQLQNVYGGGFGVSGYKIIAAKPQLMMPSQLPVLTWFNNCSNPKSDLKDLVEEGKLLLRSDIAYYNGLMSVFSYQGAEWSIHLGKILVTLKGLVRKSNQIWGGWAATNLPFIGERTREKMMRLARRKDFWRYSILGPERGDVLCAAIPESKDGGDAIGAFLERHEIRFDPTQEFDLDEFKRQIDHALATEKLQKKGLTIPALKVAALVDNGCPVDGTLIKQLQTIQRSGGDLGTHVDYLITSGGKESSDKTPEQRLQDVNHLAERLTKSIDLILSKQDLIDMIDRDIYRRLVEKLNDISMLRDMTTDFSEVSAAAA
jgi:hypothetical protein